MFVTKWLRKFFVVLSGLCFAAVLFTSCAESDNKEAPKKCYPEEDDCELSTSKSDIETEDASVSFEEAKNSESLFVDEGAWNDSESIDNRESSDRGNRDYFETSSKTSSGQTITFLHINDLHASYDPDSSSVSLFSRLKEYVSSVKIDNPYTLFTNGGDDMEKGSMVESLSQGRSTKEIIFAMGFDVRVLGNHDFAWSLNRVLEHSRDPQGVVLSSNNTYVGDNPEDWGAVKYAELQVGRVRIGFLGLTTKPYNVTDKQVSANFYPELDARYDYEELTRTIVEQHRDDVDLIVMVNHVGLNTDIKIASEVEGIDVILGGHSHTKTATPRIAGETLVIQAGPNGQAVSRLDLEYNLKERKVDCYQYQLIDINKENMPDYDRQLNDTVLAATKKYAPDLDLEIARASVDNVDKTTIARTAANAAIEFSDADAVLMKIGTVRINWPRVVTQRHLGRTFFLQRHPSGSPSGSSVYKTTIDGISLKKLRQSLDGSWIYNGPNLIYDSREYIIAMPKGILFDSQTHFPIALDTQNAVFVDEMWRLIETHLSQRNADCLFIDAERLMPDCVTQNSKLPIEPLNSLDSGMDAGSI